MEPIARGTPEPSETSPQAPGSGGADPGRRPGAAGLWLSAVVAALLAGAVSGAAGEWTRELSRPSDKESAQHYIWSALNQSMARHFGRNGAIVYGTLGGLLGLALGAAGGLARGSGSAAVAGATGLVLGAAAGASSAYVLLPWQWLHRADYATSMSLVPVLVHCGLWGGLGAAAGFAYGLGREGADAAALVRGALGGLVGALIGTVVHELVVALGFPTVRTDEVFATTTVTRMLPHLCVALFTAAGAVALLQAKPARSAG